MMLVVGLLYMAFIMLRYILCTHIVESFYHEWMLNFIKYFLYLLRLSCGFHLFFCWCALSHWLICVCRTILLTQGWIQLGCGVWSFLCAAGFATKCVWICNKNVLSIFVSIFIKDTGLKFSFFCSMFDFAIKVTVASQKGLSLLLPKTNSNKKTQNKKLLLD